MKFFSVSVTNVSLKLYLYLHIIFKYISPPARHRSTSSCLFILLVFRVSCVCVFQPHHLSAAPQTENKENCDRRHWGAESLAVYFFQHNHQVNIQRTIFTGILAEPFYGGLRLRIFWNPIDKFGSGYIGSG